MKTDFEAMGGTYTLQGDYQIPNMDTTEISKVGTWGELRRKYLCNHK